MPQQFDEIVLDAAKGPPRVEIIFGQAHIGNYRFFLWDPQGQNPKELMNGSNEDDALDSFEIGMPPSGLARAILSFELLVQAPEARDGQVYSVTITVRQENAVCPGGLIRESGPLEDVKSLVGFRRFRTI